MVQHLEKCENPLAEKKKIFFCNACAPRDTPKNTRPDIKKWHKNCSIIVMSYQDMCGILQLACANCGRMEG